MCRYGSANKLTCVRISCKVDHTTEMKRDVYIYSDYHCYLSIESGSDVCIVVLEITVRLPTSTFFHFVYLCAS